MTTSKNILRTLVLATGLTLCVPFAQAAGGHQHCPEAMRHPAMMGPEFGMHDGAGPALPFLRDLKLTESQRDQIFKIFHEQAPALREKHKELHKLHQELHAQPFSAQYDEAKIKALAESSARTMAEIIEMRATSLNQVYQLLTPEQRKKAEEQKAAFESRGMRWSMPAYPTDQPMEPRRR